MPGQSSAADILSFSKDRRFCPVGIRQKRISSNRFFPLLRGIFGLGAGKGHADQAGDGILEKIPGSGREELKSAIKRYLALNRGMDVEPERIIIPVPGAEYLYRR